MIAFSFGRINLSSVEAFQQSFSHVWIKSGQLFIGLYEFGILNTGQDEVVGSPSNDPLGVGAGFDLQAYRAENWWFHEHLVFKTIFN